MPHAALVLTQSKILFTDDQEKARFNAARGIGSYAIAGYELPYQQIPKCFNAARGIGSYAIASLPNLRNTEPKTQF